MKTSIYQGMTHAGWTKKDINIFMKKINLILNKNNDTKITTANIDNKEVNVNFNTDIRLTLKRL